MSSLIPFDPPPVLPLHFCSVSSPPTLMRLQPTSGGSRTHGEGWTWKVCVCVCVVVCSCVFMCTYIHTYIQCVSCVSGETSACWWHDPHPFGMSVHPVCTLHALLCLNQSRLCVLLSLKHGQCKTSKCRSCDHWLLSLF